MINTQNAYLEPIITKPNETKGKVEPNESQVIFVRRNFNPSTVLEMRFARLKKVMRRRSSGII